MKLGFSKNIDMYSAEWIQYCKLNHIEYKLIDVYSSDVIEQLRDCDGFLWHHDHGNYKDVLFAKQLLYTLEQSGKKVWPNFNTGWHFDDKVGESYLYDSLNLPIVPYHIFYTKSDAIRWLPNAKYPLVFKLRGGGGSTNVQLIKNQFNAKRIIDKAFKNGFASFRRSFIVYARYKKWKAGHDTFVGVLKGLIHSSLGGILNLGNKYLEYAKMHGRERGYVYFQDFMPNNDRDYRVVVIDSKRAFAYYRLVRKGDFRASGSGEFYYDNFPVEIVELAFKVAKSIKAQSLALDFVYDQEGNPRIVESSYAFGYDDTDSENGYWTDDIQFHKDKFNPFYWIVESVINDINLSNNK